MKVDVWYCRKCRSAARTAPPAAFPAERMCKCTTPVVALKPTTVYYAA